MWPYRDWVINAFAANMPFNRFTREQLAGDLLPDATRDQKIAAAYNRLNLMSAEGGGQDKEYHAKYASDRVRATSGAWLGSTLGCAECHDHKFDPFTTRDFYAFAAFFADVQEKGIYHGANGNGIWGEMMWLPSPEQAAKQADLEAQIVAAKAAVDAADGDAPRGEAAAELKRLEEELKAAIDAQPHMPATVSGSPRIVRVATGWTIRVRSSRRHRPPSCRRHRSPRRRPPTCGSHDSISPAGSPPSKTRSCRGCSPTGSGRSALGREYRAASTTTARRESRRAIQNCSTGWPANSATGTVATRRGTSAACCD